jgi:hypothetical protein
MAFLGLGSGAGLEVYFGSKGEQDPSTKASRLCGGAMKKLILAAVLGAFSFSGFAADNHGAKKEGKKAESCKMECCTKNKTACKDCKDCKEKMAKAEKKA